MTLAQAISIIGVLFGLLCALVGYIWKKLEKRMDGIEQRSETGELARFKAFDAEREKHWMFWRENRDRAFDEYVTTQAKWRHDELSPLLRNLGLQISKLEERADGHRGRIERIETRLNGK